MTVDWGLDSPDLFLTLDRNSGPLKTQIQDQLRMAIRERRLVGGERLPSTRRLAELLGVARGTIVDVYEQLLAEGYVESTVGSGTRVATMSADPQTSGVVTAPAARTSSRRIEIDFEYGIPDLGSVPLNDWSRALSEATRTLAIADLGDEEPAGSMHLREVVTAYHRRVRSGFAVAEHAVIVSGFRQGLAFVLSTLARYGIHEIALEDPGPREHDVIARRAGLAVAPVPVDDDGLDVDRLRETKARAVLVTPAHQCPTGVVLSPSRRRDLIAWADDVDGVILEDDYDAEFRYDRQPVGSLQGLNTARVIALGSVSKTLAPAIKLGWVLAPEHLVSGIVEEKRLSSRGAPGLDQEALALFMESGRFDRHLRKVREIYRARRDVLAFEIEASFGPGRLQGLAAGCHALLRLPEGTSEAAVESIAASLGVRVNGLGQYRLVAPETKVDQAPHPPGLVLGFGNVTEQQIRKGVGRVVQAVQRAHGGVRSSSGGDPVS